MPIFSQFTPNSRFNEVLISLKYILLPFLINNSDRHSLKLEQTIQQNYFPEHQVTTFDSGRTSLHQILEAYKNLQPDLKNTEILLAGHTCLVVSNAIIKSELTPKYIDFKPNSFQIDPQQIEKNITPKTKFILLQHTFGYIEDTESIQKIAKKHNLIIIEDLAHSFLSQKENILLGNFSDAAFLSFGSNKIISCLRGGAIITKNQSLSDQLKIQQQKLDELPTTETLKYHLKHVIFYISQPIYNFLKLGKIIMAITSKLRLIPKVISFSEKQAWVSKIPNYKISDSLAHIALKQLKHTNQNSQTRNQIANQYYQALHNHPKIKCYQPDQQSAPLFFPIIVNQNKQIYTILKRHGVHLNLDWTGSPLAPNMSSLQKWQLDPKKTPYATLQAKHMLLLPTHQKMTSKKADKIIKLILKYYELNS